MNDYQVMVDTLFKAKMREYDPEQMTDDLECELYGEAVKEALTQLCDFERDEED